MSITLIMGPMFSGKTTELIRLVQRATIAEKKNLIIKHKIDNRYCTDNKNITTHGNHEFSNSEIRCISEFTPEFINDVIKDYQTVAIEEGHFFKDLNDFCKTLANNNIDVIVSALDGSYEQKMFDEIAKLIPNTEKVIKLSSICMSCKNKEGHFTIRTIKSDEQILVGGSDIYMSVCRSCLNKFNS
jgi:thymidine kinase